MMQLLHISYLIAVVLNWRLWSKDVTTSTCISGGRDEDTRKNPSDGSMNELQGYWNPSLSFGRTCKMAKMDHSNFQVQARIKERGSIK